MLRPEVSRTTAIRIVLFALVVISPPSWALWSGQAVTTRTWDGGGADNNWTTAANWEGDVVPVPGDDLIFPAGVPQNFNSNTFLAFTTFRSITFSGAVYSIGQNGLALDAGMTANGVAEITLPIRLNSNQIFTSNAGANFSFPSLGSINTNSQNLTLAGAGDFALTGIVSGSGSLSKTGTGRMFLNGNNTYTGITSVASGILNILGVQPNSAVSLTGGTLVAAKTVGAITATGGTLSPSLSTPSSSVILNVNGNLNLASTTLLIDLNGATVGTQYDQLNVTGAVNLSGTTLNVAVGSSFTPAPGDTFIILNNDGTDAVSGTFAGLPDGTAITSTGLVISYLGGDGNDVVLHVPATRTWDGRKDDGTSAANNKWSTKENWLGDVAPSPADNLVFPAGSAQSTNMNDFLAGTTFNSITISLGYNISGNAIGLNAGITSNALGTVPKIFLPIKLNADQAFVGASGSAGLTLEAPGGIDNGGHKLTLNSGIMSIQVTDITGTGGLTKSGGGSASIGNFATVPNYSYSGTTTITLGSLTVNSKQPNSPVNLTGGSLLSAGGLTPTNASVVGPLTATGGNISPGDDVSPGALNVNGNVGLSSAASYFVNLNGTTVGTQYDQLNVTGSVNLAGAILNFAVGSSFTPAGGARFVIINNDGTDPVGGIFNGLPEGSLRTVGGVTFGITYRGGDGNNDVVLTASPAVVSFSATNYAVNEGGGAANITLSRTGGGNTTAVAKVTLADVTTSPADYRFATVALDSTFDPGTGANDAVFTTALQGDGRIIIGGFFTSYNGEVRNRITRLNANGSLDLSFNNSGVGANNNVRTSAMEASGKIVIGGDLTSYNGLARGRIARLNTDGSLDLTFNPGTGANSSVETTAIQSDGKIIIGGSFTSYNGVVRNRLARLNTDGSLDMTFNSGGVGANDGVFSTMVQSDGRIVIGGLFTTYNGAARGGVARLNADGSLDLTFNNSGAGTNGSPVLSSLVQADGKIIIGGSFTSYNGEVRNRVARLNGDGSLDPNFNSVAGANGGVAAIVVQADGRILIGGAFTSYNGEPRNRVARLNPDGSLDLTFNSVPGANNTVRTIVVQPDGEIIIGGLFTTYNDLSRNCIVRVDGDLFVTWGPNDFSNKILTLPIVDDALFEGSETLNLTLGARGGTFLGTTSNATLTITDNDTAPTPSPSPSPTPTATPSPTPLTQPVVLTTDQVELKSWTLEGRTYIYVKLLFPDAGYSVTSWGQAVRTGSDFSANASVERFTGPSVLAVTTTAQIYDLGPLAAGSYTFTFKNSGVAVRSLLFTVSSATPPPNPIDDARQFVKQQYRDFLNREADQAGEDFWTDNITKCQDPARRPAGQTVEQCTLRQKETTSGAFFLSPEFQYTGYFVYRMYQGALGRQPKLSEFTPDALFVGNGIIVNGQLSGAKINQNKVDYAAQFVNCTDATKYRCSEFKAIYDGLSNQQYVDKLFLTTGVNASASERTALVNELNANPTTGRATVLQKVVDGINVIAEGNQQFTTTYGQAFYDQQFTRAFVQLEYFGYMKRDPDEAGYAFWLGKLNSFAGDFVKSEMVLAFISSPEYRARFGQP
jgi:uncharacterized delta-60 repeat protein